MKKFPLNGFYVWPKSFFGLPRLKIPESGLYFPVMKKTAIRRYSIWKKSKTVPNWIPL